MNHFRAFVLFCSLGAADLHALPASIGDLDADGQATVLDVVALVNHLNGVRPLSLPPRFADLDMNQLVNDADLQRLEEAVLGIRALPSATLTPAVNPVLGSTRQGSIVLSGNVYPGTPIRIEGGAAIVTAVADANGAFSISVALGQNRLNRLFVSGTDEEGLPSPPMPIDVLHDAQAPSLFIDMPLDGAELTTSNIVVAGRVGDMLSGFLGLAVTVNGLPGNAVVGIGPNGTFERGGVPLTLGSNLITVTAADVLGNTATRQITVMRVEPVGPRMIALSGDAQMTNIHRRLAEPIVVQVTHPNGAPFPNKVVTFEVIRSDGRLAADPINSGALTVQALTDANGRAAAYWRLGGDAGCGNNRVAVTSRDISGSVFFCASAKPAPAAQINIGTGNNQRVEAGGPAMEPLRAWVSDGCNGVAGIPVTFTVTQGGGQVNGASSITIPTSITGHAQVNFTLGPEPGNNAVEATFPGNAGQPATFIIYGVQRNPGQPTVMRGLVLDNSSQPIGGAYCFLKLAGNTVASTYSDLNGQFHMTNVPAGPAHLYVDGLPATSLGGRAIPQGSYPALHYTLTIIPNAENSLPTPVLLPRLNPNNARLYYGTNDIILTCEGMEGLKMFVKANSMRKPNGTLVSPTNPAVIALNQVHHDEVPMPMPDGAAPPFAWTLQPGAATFDPPIQIEYPNMSALPPGAIAYFLSFNHDTERFEIVASGHVINDGSCIVTDPGAGLSLAGWGCNCPPYAVTGQVQSPEVTIAGPEEVQACREQELQFSALGAPEGGTYSWSGGEVPPEGSGPSFQTKFTTSGDKIITVTYICPSGATASDSVLVRLPEFDEIEIRYRTFIACRVICAKASCFFFPLQEPEGGPTVFPSDYYSGDGRGFQYSGGTSRSYMTVKVSLDPDKAGLVQLPDFGSDPTEAYDDSMVLAPPASGNWCEDFCRYSLLPGATAECIARETDGHTFDSSYSNDTEIFRLAYRLHVNNPCLHLSAAIDASPVFEFRQVCENGVLRPAEYRITGTHDGFPWHEIYINQSQAYTYDPCNTRKTLWDLFPGEDESYGLSSWQRVPNSPAPRNRVPATFVETPLLDETWVLTLNGQAVSAKADGNFVLPNVAAADQFGLNGPGSAPDFLSDDFLRLEGKSISGNKTRYAVSERFQIRQGQTYAIREMLIGDEPPRTPESIAAIPDEFTLTETGATTQVRVSARYGDGTSEDITPRNRYTTYRTSNPGIAIVGPDGLVTAKGKGKALITAVNEGAASVAQIDITFGELTTVRGFLRDTNGNPAAGVLVRIAGGAQFATTAADGSFTITDVPTDFGVISVVSDPTVGDGTLLFARTVGLTPVPGGFTDAGIMMIQPLKAMRAPFDGGGGHTAAIGAGGTLHTWGYNFFGQLGDNTTIPKTVPTQIGNGANWAAVAAGFIHTLAIKTNGTLWAWGDNVFGQLGDGTEIDTSLPIQVGSDSDWAAIAAGEYHSLAIKRDGSLWAWGANFVGQLGDGSGLDQSAPVKIGSENDWITVAAGDRHSLAVKRDGSLWAWGSNVRGQLGDASGQDQFEPVPVDASPGWIAITAGESHSLGLMADGSLWAWGANHYGQLGDLSFSDQFWPSPVGETYDWIAVASGLHHTLALKADGSLWAWGRNSSGQLGDGSAFQQEAPVQVGSAHDWLAIAAGDHHSLALKRNGTLWSWGRNSSGQLGDGSNFNKSAPAQVLSPGPWKKPE